MSKIDFTKVEEKLMLAIHAMFVKKINAGKSVVSPRAINFFRLNDGPRPKPPDAILQAIDEMRQEQELLEKELEEAQSAETIPADTPNVPQAKPSESVAPSSTPTSTNIPSQGEKALDEESEEELNPKLIPWYYLQQHLMWFKKKKVKDVYTTLNVTKDELNSYDKKRDFSNEEFQRIEQILEKAKELKMRKMKEMGLATDETLIESQRRTHIYKRFNIRENWLPLQ